MTERIPQETEKRELGCPPLISPFRSKSQNDISAISSRLHRLTNAYLDEAMELVEYQEHKNALMAEKKSLEEKFAKFLNVENTGNSSDGFRRRRRRNEEPPSALTRDEVSVCGHYRYRMRTWIIDILEKLDKYYVPYFDDIITNIKRWPSASVRCLLCLTDDK